MFFDNVRVNTIGNLLAPFLPSARVYWLYLFTAVVLAFIAYHQLHHDHDEDGNDVPSEGTSFLKFLFNKDVWFHRSSLQDYKFFVINALIYYGIAVQFLLGTHHFAVFFHKVLLARVGELTSPAITSEVSLIVYTVVSVMFVDLGVYLGHRLMHTVPFLWEFHKVHHSAEKLNPMTLFRMHPVDLFITATIVGVLGGAAYAGLFYLTGEVPKSLTLFGLNVVTFAFYLGGYNLRHSHVWLSYPVWLGKILISPAQHQIHHSADPKHYDRNFGLIFSFWDRVGNSHYIPREREKLTFGLSKEEPNPFGSVSEIYVKPFQWSWAILFKSLDTPFRKAMAGLAGVLVLLGYVSVGNQTEDGFAFAGPPSVHLERLTWTEVDLAMREGYETVIIPTGGIEQNGPHAILGKHNVVVSRAAQMIAKEIGQTLVAPVIDHVPEGDIEPKKDGHMRFAGTISVPDEVFQQILEATARSLKAHGFRRIFFIGDSYGNQDGQAEVAKRLTLEWAHEDITIAHIGDYYSANGQFKQLQKDGFTDGEIGYHAGIRDTSELLFADPSSVHYKYVQWPEGKPSGFSGSPGKASAEIGRKMIGLKVQAALRQIHSVVGCSVSCSKAGGEKQFVESAFAN